MPIYIKSKDIRGVNFVTFDGKSYKRTGQTKSLTSTNPVNPADLTKLYVATCKAAENGEVSLDPGETLNVPVRQDAGFQVKFNADTHQQTGTLNLVSQQGTCTVALSVNADNKLVWDTAASGTPNQRVFTKLPETFNYTDCNNNRYDISLAAKGSFIFTGGVVHEQKGTKASTSYISVSSSAGDAITSSGYYDSVETMDDDLQNANTTLSAGDDQNIVRELVVYHTADMTKCFELEYESITGESAVGTNKACVTFGPSGAPTAMWLDFNLTVHGNIADPACGDTSKAIDSNNDDSVVVCEYRGTDTVERALIDGTTHRSVFYLYREMPNTIMHNFPCDDFGVVSMVTEFQDVDLADLSDEEQQDLIAATNEATAEDLGVPVSDVTTELEEGSIRMLTRVQRVNKARAEHILRVRETQQRYNRYLKLRQAVAKRQRLQRLKSSMWGRYYMGPMVVSNPGTPNGRTHSIILKFDSRNDWINPLDGTTVSHSDSFEGGCWQLVDGTVHPMKYRKLSPGTPGTYYGPSDSTGLLYDAARPSAYIGLQRWSRRYIPGKKVSSCNPDFTVTRGDTLIIQNEGGDPYQSLSGAMLTVFDEMGQIVDGETEHYEAVGFPLSGGAVGVIKFKNNDGSRMQFTYGRAELNGVPVIPEDPVLSAFAPTHNNTDEKLEYSPTHEKPLSGSPFDLAPPYTPMGKIQVMPSTITIDPPEVIDDPIVTPPVEPVIPAETYKCIVFDGDVSGSNSISTMWYSERLLRERAGSIAKYESREAHLARYRKNSITGVLEPDMASYQEHINKYKLYSGIASRGIDSIIAKYNNANPQQQVNSLFADSGNEDYQTLQQLGVQRTYWDTNASQLRKTGAPITFRTGDNLIFENRSSHYVAVTDNYPGQNSQDRPSNQEWLMNSQSGNILHPGKKLYTQRRRVFSWLHGWKWIESNTWIFSKYLNVLNTKIPEKCEHLKLFAPGNHLQQVDTETATHSNARLDIHLVALENSTYNTVAKTNLDDIRVAEASKNKSMRDDVLARTRFYPGLPGVRPPQSGRDTSYYRIPTDGTKCEKKTVGIIPGYRCYRNRWRYGLPIGIPGFGYCPPSYGIPPMPPTLRSA